MTEQLVVCGACDNEYDIKTQDQRCPHVAQQLKAGQESMKEELQRQELMRRHSEDSMC